MAASVSNFPFCPCLTKAWPWFKQAKVPSLVQLPIDVDDMGSLFCRWCSEWHWLLGCSQHPIHQLSTASAMLWHLLNLERLRSFRQLYLFWWLTENVFLSYQQNNYSIFVCLDIFEGGKGRTVLHSHAEVHRPGEWDRNQISGPNKCLSVLRQWSCGVKLSEDLNISLADLTSRWREFSKNWGMEIFGTRLQTCSLLSKEQSTRAFPVIWEGTELNPLS